jgi:site-specific DNA-methyltransferase (adenine-specific)
MCAVRPGGNAGNETQKNAAVEIVMVSQILFSSRSEEWGTPLSLFAELDREFDFTLDPCATRYNAKCARYYDAKLDGLKQDWTGERVFMNPPYGRQIGDWMKKARLEAAKGALVVCLVHARTDTRWWHENVEGNADEVRFIRGRVKFERQQGATFCAPFPSAVVIYRPRKPRPQAWFGRR